MDKFRVWPLTDFGTELVPDGVQLKKKNVFTSRYYERMS